MPEDDIDRSADVFDCPGCGRRIYSLPRRNPPPTLCATCTWLEEFVEDPVERAKLKERMCS
jgi:hypothetical protein